MYAKAISYSGKSLWDQCPRRWHNAYILGNREPSGPAAERGTHLHDLLEKYFKKESTFPASNKVLAPFRGFMEGLFEMSPVAEGEVAVTSDWKPCSFDDPNAYARGKKDLDIHAGSTLFILDWKSGKVYDDHWKQGKMYPAMTPGFERYVVGFVYLDQPFLVRRWEYSAKEIEEYREELSEEIEVIRNATEYPAIPGDGCGYCNLSWRKGGDCKRAR